eukprot:765968-Hanusia_phi.AAC.5
MANTQEDDEAAQPVNYDQAITIALTVALEPGKIEHNRPTLARARNMDRGAVDMVPTRSTLLAVEGSLRWLPTRHMDRLGQIHSKRHSHTMGKTAIHSSSLDGQGMLRTTHGTYKNGPHTGRRGEAERRDSHMVTSIQQTLRKGITKLQVLEQGGVRIGLNRSYQDITEIIKRRGRANL